MAVESGVKWEVGMDALYVEFQVSLKSEGLLTLFTLPLLFVGERMKIFDVSLHIFHSFELLTAKGMLAMMHFSWFLQWILGWFFMDIPHMSFEILQRDLNLANATLSHYRYLWIAFLAPSVLYKLFEVSKLFRALLTANSFSMSPQLMILQ